MITAKPATNRLLHYFDLVYFLKFALLFALLYYGNLFFVSLVSPYGSYYSPFLDQNLNYVAVLRASFLQAADLAMPLFGLETFIPNAYTLRVVDGAYVIMGDECIGLGVMSFWTAFVLADSRSWRTRVLWGLSGLAAIWLINYLRVLLLVLAYAHEWQLIVHTDHHTMFNYMAYALVMLLIWRYHLSGQQELKRQQTDNTR